MCWFNFIVFVAPESHFCWQINCISLHFRKRNSSVLTHPTHKSTLRNSLTFSKPGKIAACKSNTQTSRFPLFNIVSSSSARPGIYMGVNEIAERSMPQVVHENFFKKPSHGVSQLATRVDQNICWDMTSFSRKHTQFTTWKCQRRDLYNPSVNWKITGKWVWICVWNNSVSFPVKPTQRFLQSSGKFEQVCIYPRERSQSLRRQVIVHKSSCSHVYAFPNSVLGMTMIE